MTTHWKIPKPEWKLNNTLYASGRYLGRVDLMPDYYLGCVPKEGFHGKTEKFTTMAAARSWVEAQAMKALGAEEIT